MADEYPTSQEFSGGDYGRTATAGRQPFRGIVIHVTGRPTLQSEEDYMSKPDPNRPGQYGYHYLIDRDGSIHQTAPFDVRTNHIMPNSQFGLSNNNAIGVAMVGGDKGMTPAQIAAGEQLTGQLQKQFNIPNNMVVSHGMLDPKTRGAGNNLGVDNSAEGSQFMTAFNSGQPSQPPQPSRPATITPGTTLNSSPMDLVANLESSNTNVNQKIRDINSERGTPARGYFQIIDPTWRTYAPKVGVDLNQYPTALDAPRDVQAKVASAIPVNQWGANTVVALKAKYPGIDTGLTLGQFQSAALAGGGASGSPAVAAGGGSAPAATPAPQQQFAGVTAGSPAEKSMAAAQKSFAGGGDSSAPELPPAPPLPPAQAQGGLMMMGPGGMNQLPRALAQQYLQQQGVQTAPSLASFTAGALPPPVQSAMPGQASGAPAMPGTTLNSPSQLQMALMTGAINPYDLYAGGGSFGGYQGS